MLNRRLKSGSTNSTATSLSGCSVCLRLDDIIKKIMQHDLEIESDAWTFMAKHVAVLF